MQSSALHAYPERKKDDLLPSACMSELWNNFFNYIVANPPVRYRP
jgi:hypothetical protein